MKAAFALALLALFLAPGPCFALWDVLTLTPEDAERLGLEVRTSGNPENVAVELEFPLDDNFKEFEAVNLTITNEGESIVTAPLREERTVEGSVIVSFWASRDQLDKLDLSIRVPGGPGVAGGTLYEMSVDAFVD